MIHETSLRDELREVRIELEKHNDHSYRCGGGVARFGGKTAELAGLAELDERASRPGDEELRPGDTRGERAEVWLGWLMGFERRILYVRCRT